MAKLSDEDIERIAEQVALKLARQVHVLPPSIYIDPRYVTPPYSPYNPYRVMC